MFLWRWNGAGGGCRRNWFCLTQSQSTNCINEFLYLMAEFSSAEMRTREPRPLNDAWGQHSSSLVHIVECVVVVCLSNKEDVPCIFLCKQHRHTHSPDDNPKRNLRFSGRHQNVHVLGRSVRPWETGEWINCLKFSLYDVIELLST